MSEISRHSIEHLASISVTGNDAMTFLQGQCTQDLTKIPSFGALPGAFCSAKGRVISNVWLLRVNDSQESFVLICHQTSAPLLFAHLKKYVPFFRGTTMTVNTNQSLKLTGYMGTQDLPGFMINDTMSIELDSSDNIGEQASNTQWQAEEIKLGILWLDDHQIEKWVPQNLSLDTLNTISFSKGCYTGQEVVARLHYKGSSKKRLYSVSSDREITNLQTISAGEKNVGNILQVAFDQGQYHALAVLNSTAAESRLFMTENEQVTIELLHSF